MYKTLFYCISLTLAVLPPQAIWGMQEQIVPIDKIEQASAILSNEVTCCIRSGDVITLHSTFSRPNQLPDDLVKHNTLLLSALEYTNNEIAVLEGDMPDVVAKPRCCSRYRFTLLPTVVIAYSIANITISALSYNLIEHPTGVDIASLSLNVAGSALTGIIFSSYEVIKHMRAAWHNTEQKELIRQLKISQIYLNLAHEKNNKST